MKAEGWRMWTGRRWLLVALVLAMGWAVGRLGTDFVSLTPGADPLASAARFFGAAFSPALSDQNPNLPADATPLLTRLGGDLLRTLRYALMATAISIPAGLVLGFAASRQWWPRERFRGVLGWVRWPVRVLLSLLRAIHELIWAIFFLSAMGDSPIAACLALALPFTGALAKVFSELMDEQDESAKEVMTSAGAGGPQGFVAAVFPAALPDMISYSLYRFECALRSSAVLGFMGIETIGLSIGRSFESSFYGEVWTAVYLLIATILLIEGFGAMIRKRLATGFPGRKKTGGELTEARLRRAAPRDWRLRFFGMAWLVAVVLAFQLGGRLTLPVAEERQEERLSRFWSKITPAPVAPERALADWEDRAGAWEKGKDGLIPWISGLWESPGKEALLDTVAMSVAAVILAGLGALAFVPWALRTLASARPLGLDAGGGRWRTVAGGLVRGGFVVSRAVPEYLYAFLLVGLLGPSPWPLVVAIALHNFGILGRLWSEVGENQNPGPAKVVMAMGGSRTQAFCGALTPPSLNRFLLFFFYRWESCLREATVLGMLGVSSLGYYISIRKSFREYDEIVFFSLLGAVVIIAGDLASDALRRKLREG